MSDKVVPLQPPTRSFLSIEEVMAVDDVQYVELEVPEWKGRIRLGSLNAGDMIEFIESNEGPAKKTAGLRLIVKSLVDAEGNRTGNDALLQVLKKRNQKVCNDIVAEILKLNGLDKKEQDAVKNA